MQIKLRHTSRKRAIAIIAAIIAVAMLFLWVMRGDEVGNCGTKELQGIDVSHHQGTIDWEAVATNQDIKFAYIKASEGSSHKDSRYKTNTEQARKAGIAVGSYHYFHPNVPVKSQIDNFMSMIDTSSQDLVPVVDIEISCNFTAKQICDSLTRFSDMLSQAWNVRPIIYTHQRFYNDFLQLSFGEYGLWIARYGAYLLKPRPRLEDLRNCVLWQYSNRGRIKGIKGYVDLNSICEGFTLEDISINHR